MTRYVRVAVPVPLHRLFTYEVPAGVEVEPGMRVRVRFGNRHLVGMVAELPGETVPADLDVSRVRALDAVLDHAAVVTGPVLELCQFIARYYHVPPGQAYALPVPPEMSGGRTGKVREHRFQTERVLTFVRQPDPTSRVGARMRALLDWLAPLGEADAREAREHTGADLGVMRRLEAQGLVVLSERRRNRDPYRDAPVMDVVPHPLTVEQKAAVDAVRASWGRYQGVALHGVTGSGKTEVYLALIQELLDSTPAKQALVLVPEISLTPQLVARFRGRLGERIAVLHSGLDRAARYEQWVRIAAGELPVVVGARSALFAPLTDVGLIVVDEEHDSSFKQDVAPQYNARDMALVRGRIEGCPVVLGSATPSLETWANVVQGKLTRLRMAKRVSDRPMPGVTLVDLREAVTVDEKGMFSAQLVDAMTQTLERKEQAILLLNRRGYAAFVLCRACGHTLSCAKCSVSYTWHRGRRRLVCHYCDRGDALPPACPACQDDALEEVGVGTERVEELLSVLLPQARVERMDRDTTRGQALGKLLARFRAREIDILVGTQMVAKGHDFPGVTLVGVLLAEQGLKLPDFRATERTFHLLTQIAGRAGRAELPGQVLVQTYHPGHYALVMASEHDTETFLGRELEERQARGFPPCTHLALYKVTGKDRFAVQRWAEDLMRLLRDIVHQDGRIAPGTVVVGAAQPAVIERIKEKWRFQVLLNATERGALRAALTAAGEALDSLKRPSTIQLVLDVDPHALL